MLKQHHIIILHVILLYSFITHSQPLIILTQPLSKSAESSWYHQGVTHSLLRGLTKLNVDFKFNPASLDSVGSTVVVLTNIDALAQAIQLKKLGVIKKILAGPNLMVRSNEYNHILSSPEIDICLVPSEWIKKAYIEDEPQLINKIKIWPAGVDIHEWHPPKNKLPSKQVLLYWKTEPITFCQEVENLLRKHSWEPVTIQYGQYTPAIYKELLANSAFAVFLSRSESQSIALTEAWAMNIPTLVWDPKKLNAFNKEYSEVSACPYLTPKTGISWETIKELQDVLSKILDQLPTFTPRKWVLKNMSDAASANILIDIISSIDHN